MTTPQITTPGAPPDPLAPQPTFRATFYAYLQQLVTAFGQANTVATWMATTSDTVAANATTASTAAINATAAQTAAENAASATAWVSGGSYTLGDVHWSLIDFLPYRAKTTHSGLTTDPSLDDTNWALQSSLPFDANAHLSQIQATSLSF